MEIPVLNRITKLEGDFSSIPDVNFPSQILNYFPGISKFSPSQNFFKWGAIILALLATFTSLIKKVKIFIIPNKQKTNPISETYDSIPENPRSESDEPPSTAVNRKRNDDESDFTVKGSADKFLRRRHRVGEIDEDSYSLSYLSSNRNVVKKWGEEEICSVYGGETLVTAVYLSPGKGGLGNVRLELWDTAVLAAWNSPSRKGKIVNEFSGDADKGMAGIMVGDGRKVGSAFESLTECGDVSWWWDWEAYADVDV